MHRHSCRYCQESFICPTSADVCFKDSIVCEECSWQTDFNRFVAVFMLTVAAVGLTLYLISQLGEQR